MVCLGDDRCRGLGTGNLAPPSDMGRGWTQQCIHAWTPILAAATISRDYRVGQGGTPPAYGTVGMILPDVITPRLVKTSR